MTTIPKPDNSHLFGGEPFTITYRLAAGSPANTPLDTEEVFVRDVKPSELGLYFANSHSMTSLVEVMCDKPAGWGDTLEFSSLCDLHSKVTGRNDPTFALWLEKMGPKLARLAQGSLSSNSARG